MGADMGRQASQVSEDSASRFEKYVGVLTSVVGHADRAASMHYYCVGLVAAEGRKSVEPMAAVTAPTGGSAQLGKQANCQVAVTLSIANHHASLPIAYRLYLPREWAEGTARRKKAHVPKAITFKTKPQIALEQIRAAWAAGVPGGAVLFDASYGSNSRLRSGVSELGLSYVAAIVATVKVVAVPKRGAPERRMSVKALAQSLPKHAWRTIPWREGTNEQLRSRFARVQVRTAPIRRAAERAEETLVIEWPEGEAEPTKYWLSTLDKNVSFSRLAGIAKMRWRVERDYQELKQEVGLGHYEGRGWPGFHHHGTLCIAVYGFLAPNGGRSPPQ